MDLHSDPERLLAFRRGDRDLLADLYDAYLGDVEKLLRNGFTFSSQGKTVRFRGFDEPFRLQEAIQDGFLRAFREPARHAYDASQPWRPYLLTIVRNHVIDGFRRESTRQKYFVPLTQAVPKASSEHEALEHLSTHRPHTSPETLAMQRQLQSTLGAFLSSLDDHDRIIVERHLSGDLTQHEVAQLLDISRNDVRKRIRLLRQSLLRHLKSHGVIDSLDPSLLFDDLSAMLVLLSAPRGLS